MYKSSPSNPLLLKDSRNNRPNPREYPQTNDTSVTIIAPCERIAFLEKELVETKLQLACAMKSIDMLKLRLTGMRSADVETTGTSNTNRCALLCCANDGTVGNNANTHQENPTKSTHVPTSMNTPTSVPTSNPFSRKRKVDRVKRARLARTSANKVLNPGSCSSGVNLLVLAQFESNSSLMSLHRAATLNPNSCASGLNLMSGLQASCGISISELLESSQRNNSSALLLGSARSSSLSLLTHGGSSRKNMRLNIKTKNQGNKSNADWGVFEEVPCVISNIK